MAGTLRLQTRVPIPPKSRERAQVDAVSNHTMHRLSGLENQSKHAVAMVERVELPIDDGALVSWRLSLQTSKRLDACAVDAHKLVGAHFGQHVNDWVRRQDERRRPTLDRDEVEGRRPLNPTGNGPLRRAPPFDAEPHRALDGLDEGAEHVARQRRRNSRPARTGPDEMSFSSGVRGHLRREV